MVGKEEGRGPTRGAGGGGAEKEDPGSWDRTNLDKRKTQMSQFTADFTARQCHKQRVRIKTTKKQSKF